MNYTAKCWKVFYIFFVTVLFYYGANVVLQDSWSWSTTCWHQEWFLLSTMRKRLSNSLDRSDCVLRNLVQNLNKWSKSFDKVCTEWPRAHGTRCTLHTPRPVTPHSEAELGSVGAFVTVSWAAWQTDRQTPLTSVTIVCMSCIRCNLKPHSWVIWCCMLHKMMSYRQFL